ncbi:DUF2480 family protein [Aureivirga marina]|uniref:DUF2480 family protein n=1 Tax=Aureivirga marina TaxID=1182451 RepID=UPI0018CADD9A|nr:DUF2480 family protein [Aureivirga marina]
MAEEIVNRVAKSPLVTIYLEDYFPTNPRMEIDIKNWLFEGIILKEKDFRAYLEEHNWEQYQDAFVSIFCSEDAIIPTWAYMLVATKVTPFAKKVMKGNKQDLENAIFQEIINNLDYSTFEGKPVIIKGCASKPIPENVYVHLIEKLQPVAKSIMFGEACSTVPLYKKKK